VAVLIALAVCFGLSALGPHAPRARAATVGSLQRQISSSQSAVSGLAGQLGATTGRLNQIRGSVAQLEAQINRIQADLDAKRAELLSLRSQLDAARTRLNKLVATMNRDTAILAKQLVSTYESDKPDIVSVVLDSTGFQNLLEQLSFQQRVRKENVEVINAVRAAKRAVTAQAIRLGALEARQQRLTEQVLQERNRLAATQVGLLREEIGVAHTRDRQAGRLASARGHLASLRHQLSALLAAQAAAAARARAAAAAAAAQSSPVTAAVNSSGSGATIPPSQVSSSGGFTFPLPRGSVVGPGAWSLDDGVDMAAPGDTPEFAVCSGTIVLHGIGGFGPWAPVIHCDSPLAGYSYVYYGHAGPADQLPVGTHVSAGQVMSSVGPGIVGISTGPHIEIGFCDSSGTPLGPGTAPAMMALLHSAY